jgi:hypothetical protein
MKLRKKKKSAGLFLSWTPTLQDSRETTLL